MSSLMLVCHIINDTVCLPLVDKVWKIEPIHRANFHFHINLPALTKILFPNTLFRFLLYHFANILWVIILCKMMTSQAFHTYPLLNVLLKLFNMVIVIIFKARKILFNPKIHCWCCEEMLCHAAIIQRIV